MGKKYMIGSLGAMFIAVTMIMAMYYSGREDSPWSIVIMIILTIAGVLSIAWSLGE